MEEAFGKVSNEQGHHFRLCPKEWYIKIQCQGKQFIQNFTLRYLGIQVTGRCDQAPDQWLGRKNHSQGIKSIFKMPKASCSPGPVPLLQVIDQQGSFYDDVLPVRRCLFLYVPVFILLTESSRSGCFHT